jgi:selenocysteine lyase/cysteine desulfurase
LGNLHHDNGLPLVHFHGPSNTDMRGGTVTISLYDTNGVPLDDHRIEELANHENISLRTGCFCNPGAGETTHGLSEQQMRTFFEQKAGQEKRLISFMELRQIMQERYCKSVSAVRISVGIASNFDDVYRFMHFISGFLNKTSEQVGIATYDQHSAHTLRDAA